MRLTTAQLTRQKNTITIKFKMVPIKAINASNTPSATHATVPYTQHIVTEKQHPMVVTHRALCKYSKLYSVLDFRGEEGMGREGTPYLDNSTHTSKY